MHEGWIEEAPCAGKAETMFDPEQESYALALCRRCPFHVECHELFNVARRGLLRHEQMQGVWFGTTEANRNGRRHRVDKRNGRKPTLMSKLPQVDELAAARARRAS